MVTIEDFDRAFSWSDIAGLAEQAGRDGTAPSGRDSWKEHALGPGAPAAQRMLVEFLAYLTEDEMPEAISTEDLLVFRLADQAITKVESMLRIAALGLVGFPVVADKKDNVTYDNDSTAGVRLTCIDFDLPAGHWLAAESGCCLALAVAPTDAGAPWDEEGPRIYAGLYVGEEGAKTIQADTEWMSAASGRNLEPLAYEPGLWLVRELLLSEFTSAGDTLDHQATALGRWLSETLTSAAEMGPPADSARNETAAQRIHRRRLEREN